MIGNNLSEHCRMAVQLRLCEKNILQTTHEYANRMKSSVQDRLRMTAFDPTTTHAEPEALQVNGPKAVEATVEEVENEIQIEDQSSTLEINASLVSEDASQSSAIDPTAETLEDLDSEVQNIQLAEA